MLNLQFTYFRKKAKGATMMPRLLPRMPIRSGADGCPTTKAAC